MAKANARSWKVVAAGFAVVAGLGVALYRQVVAPPPAAGVDAAEVAHGARATVTAVAPVGPALAVGTGATLPQIDPTIDRRASIDLPPIAHPPPSPAPELSADERALFAAH